MKYICNKLKSIKTMTKIKCAKCAKKISLFTFTCKCERVFCINCRNSIDHDCSYDHVSDERRKLQLENQKVVGDKLIKV